MGDVEGASCELHVRTEKTIKTNQKHQIFK